jgi:hypothetical protein
LRCFRRTTPKALDKLCERTLSMCQETCGH